jgi:hypothetical protein
MSAAPDHMPQDHTIPVSLHDLRALLARDGLLVPGTPEAAEADRMIGLLRAECNARADALKRLYAEAHAGDDEFWRPAPPDPATLEARNQALIAAMQETLERANYKPITDQHLASAMQAEAIFNVQVRVDMQQFRALHLWARGRRPRTETLTSWFGLRTRTITFDVFDRVFVFAKLDPVATPDARRAKKAKRRPKELNLKLFRGIPLPDLEMLLPNSRITMRRLDKAAILVPMGVSIVMAASKVLLSLTAIWGAVQFAVGLSKDPPAVSGGWLIVVAGCGTLLGIAMGAYTKYQKRRLEYTSAYTETLYYQTLDSEAGAFLRVLDEAFEEEAKEAVLAWVFTRRHGDLPLDELDARVERWLEEKTGRKVDFEVEDAVGKLERLGVSGAQQAPS